MGSRVDEGRGLQLVCMQPTPLHAAIQVLTCMQGVARVNCCMQALTIEKLMRRAAISLMFGSVSIAPSSETCRHSCKVEGKPLGGSVNDCVNRQAVPHCCDLAIW